MLLVMVFSIGFRWVNVVLFLEVIIVILFCVVFIVLLEIGVFSMLRFNVVNVVVIFCVLVFEIVDEIIIVFLGFIRWVMLFLLNNICLIWVVLMIRMINVFMMLVNFLVLVVVL